MTTRTVSLALLVCLALIGRTSPGLAAQRIEEGEMAGYLLVPNEKAPPSFNAGYSMYVAAWPLLEKHPGNRFQTGLFGTWMFAQIDGPKPLEKMYSDIEGGLGWWRDTQYATATPKFIMGGVALNFVEWANGPGAGKGRDWNQPRGKYAVAQLTPWLLWPPDGLNLKQGACGRFFGYGYLPLPLTSPKTTTAGKNVPTGNQCWTLFLNTGNFKGPVAFFTPYFWSRAAVDDPRLAGFMLDSRPSNPNRALQMETQYIPAAQAVDANGVTWARVAATSFPRNSGDGTAAVHRIASYTRRALWDRVQAWFDGGPPADGRIDPAEAHLHVLPGRGGATWRIYSDKTPKEERAPVAWSTFATPTAHDPHTFGYRWDFSRVKRADSPNGPLATLPEYFRLGSSANGKPEWQPVAAADVPAETGLAQVRLGRPSDRRLPPYVTPDDPASCWKKPGPKAGPFQVRLGDGSIVTYYWYRFCEQPALLNADLTDAERQAVQERVEKLHRLWKRDRDYLPPPTTGQLADLDPALIVTPPRGLEIGYVPIVTRQGAAE